MSKSFYFGDYIAMGRHKKPVEQHLLDGTYRADRHGGSVETAIIQYLELPKDFSPPATIKDSFVKSQYKNHTRLLANLNILTVSDLPEINIMYETLQEYRRIYKELQKEKIKIGTDEYDKLSLLLLRYGKRFSEYAVRYCISPAARNRLTLETLQTVRLKKEIDKKDTITAKLVKRKRA
jgi:hypothetical protein